MNLDAPPGFTGLLIDRADNLREEEERIAELASSIGARLLRLSGLDPELTAEGRLAWSSTVEIAGEEGLIFLGIVEGNPLFAALTRVDVFPSRPSNLFGQIGEMDPGDAALWGTARSLLAWHNRHRFCSNCGSATRPFRAGWGRRCLQCASDHFPRVDPVVIMLAEHRGRVLVGRQAQFPPGRYSALAGYVEPGESIEEAVARELKEEAGIAVANIRYVASQPWPFPGALMIACLAEAESDALTIDPSELEHALWVDRNDVAAALARDEGAPFMAPPHFAIANTLFRRWLKQA